MKTQNSFDNLPASILAKWQEITDLIADILSIPAALIMKAKTDYLEVLVSSKTEKNPYHKGDKLEGSYCEKGIEAQEELVISSSLTYKPNNQSAESQYGMISYLGFAIRFPDGKPFGTLCVFDNKENSFDQKYRRLVLQFKETIEQDLVLFQMNQHKGDEITKFINEQEHKVLQKEEELERAQKKAEESNANIQAIIENTTNDIWSIDSQYCITYINQAFRNNFHKSFGAWLNVGDSVIDCLPLPLQSRWRERYERVFNNEHFSIEEAIQVAPHNFIYIHVSFNPIVSNGKIIGASFIGSDITERKEQEHELILAKEKAEASEKYLQNLNEKLELLFDILPVGISILNVDGEITKMNKQLFRILDITEDKLFAGAYRNRKYYKSDGSILKINEFPSTRVFNGEEEVLNFEIGIKKEDNSLVWTSVSAVASLIDDWRVIIVTTDITENKKINNELLAAKLKAEENQVNLLQKTDEYEAINEELLQTNEELIKAKEAAEESEKRFKSLIENAPDGVVIIDAQGRFTYGSPSAARHFGYTESDFIGHSGDEFTYPEDLPIVLETLESIMRNPALKPKLKYRFRHKNGQLRWIETTFTNLLADKSINGIVLNFSDITERKEIELEIAESEERFKALHNASFGGIAIHDKGKILECNQGLVEMMGYSYAELMEMDGLMLVAPNSRDLVLGNILSGYEKPYEAVGQRKNGELFPIRLEARNIPYKGRNVRTVEFRDITESKRIDAMFQDIIDKNPISIQIVDKDGFTIKTNTAHTLLFGIEPPSDFSIFDELQRIGFADLIERAKNGEIVYFPDTYINVHNIYSHFPDKPVWVKSLLFPLKDITSNPVRFVIMHEDITERKEAEAELQKAKEKAEESERFANLITEQSPDIIYVYDILNNKNIFINKNIRNLLNYEIGTVPEDSFDLISLLMHPEDIKQFYEYSDLIKNWDTEYIHQFEYRLKDASGQWRWFLGKEKEFLRKNEKIISLIGVVSDITEQKKAEQQLIAAKEKAEESEERLFAYINSIPDIICYKDGSGKWLLANNADLELFCLQGVDYFNKTDLDLSAYTAEIYKESFANCMVSDEIAWQQKTISNGIEVIPTIKGERRVYDVFKVPLFQTNGERKGLAVIGRDISKLYETQQNLIAAKEKAEESDRLKTAFLQNMSHEIRTPMNAICGFSGLLNDQDLSNEKRNSFISIIQSSSNQLLSIVTDILTISSLETKQEKLSISKVCVNTIIVELLSIYKQQSINQNISLYVKKELTDIDSEILTDKTKITQVLTNLLTNALKFTHEGFIEFGYNLKNEYLEFYVKDTGIGINTELHQKIFERFRQADKSIQIKYGGTGLGLSISKGFIELLGGEIWVQSEPTKGATFYFTIPYKLANQTDNSIAPIKQNSKLATILVAEDEEYNLLLLEEFLNGMDIKIIRAKDGQEAIDICQTNANIDLVLMDIKMPVISGDIAAKLINQFRPDLPIIAQSGYALEHERAKYEGIFDDYLTKPISEKDLKQIVLKYIDKS